MLSPQALIRGLVQRALPSPNPDSTNNDVGWRMDSYGDGYTQPLVRKTHNLADEGSFFTVNNAQSGIVPTYGTTFSSTLPFITIYNNSALRCYLDYAALVVIAAGTQATTAGYTALAISVDTGNRYSSGGTNLTANIASCGASAVGNPGLAIFC